MSDICYMCVAYSNNSGSHLFMLRRWWYVLSHGIYAATPKLSHTLIIHDSATLISITHLFIALGIACLNKSHAIVVGSKCRLIRRAQMHC